MILQVKTQLKVRERGNSKVKFKIAKMFLDIRAFSWQNNLESF